MKKLLAILLLLPTFSFSHDLVLPIISVTDGDTIKTSLTLPCPLCDVSIRIINIDTPESTWRAACVKERELGLQAKVFVENLVKGHSIMTITNHDWDKYGGRINAEVLVNGKNIGEELIKAGLAKPYTGSGPKPDWCN